MRKIIYSVGAVAAIAATIFIWSKSVVVGPQTVRASVATTAVRVQLSEEMRRISPLEMMVKHGKNLPVEYWSDPF
jgi:hypothetical protein